MVRYLIALCPLFDKDIGMSYTLEHFGKTFHQRVEQACEALKQGQGIVLVDDHDRENEGDLIFPAETITPQQMNQLIQDCSGIICLCLTPEKAKQLSLQPMVTQNTSPYQTAFTISIEAKTGVTTGVSAHDRWTTVRAAIQDGASSQDLNYPGHIFPLIARSQGVLERRGHTEGSIDLVSLAGLKPASVLCELMNRDGTMKNLSELMEYAIEQQYPALSVEDIYQYRLAKMK